MILLLIEKREKLDDIIAKLQPHMTSLMKPHPQALSCDQWWNAVCVVMDGTIEIIESGCGLSLGAEAMIGQL